MHSVTFTIVPYIFFNTRTNDSFISVGVLLFSDMLSGFRIHLASAFSLRSAYSVKTVIDYVTVYRAHSLQSIRKKGVTPLSMPSLSTRHYSIYSRSIIQSSGVIRYSRVLKNQCLRCGRNLTPRFTPWHSAQASLPSAMQSRRCSCMGPYVCGRSQLLQGLG